ncbi:preprotein translocase subunit SecG [Mycoplasma sp. 2045]|uniref:preprotein translocase subunit SecG n=1 Tax=unclassified Mycoplasma TaxID=2683645 RepID=UPI00211CBF96|nr:MULTISPECIES: preprotein translocase subunit SecG [unclassified Mycoplasma]MEA4134464.1 preprotein translocase subunit SecG [Mycoplasma sp. 2704]MEA4162694.1 preprotein translocase subunit SecG [Mycoplasma sp. 4404]MEA4191029.1 preprotein translocase subunit SecG [Mycoplasma sp. 2248]MEA4206272.1 preprotein translocase subunit SecG [Mycoplasma sp. 1199]MEA4276315.1 preprotein translocase subunit SecG [Mycoplasma sp. 21DD0573]
MSTFLTVILVMVGILIVFVSLLMSPDSNGFSGALVGSGDLELFKNSKERGVKKFLKYSMIVLGAILIIASVVLRIVLKK